MARPRKTAAVDPDDSVQLVETQHSPSQSTRSKTKLAPGKVQKKTTKRTTKKKDEDAQSTKLVATKPKEKLTKAETKRLESKTTPNLTPELSAVLSLSAPTILHNRAAEPITEADILAANSPAKLTSLINSLVSTEQDDLFERYRQTTRLQLSNDSRLIAELRSELSVKQSTIDTLLSQIQKLQESIDDPAGTILPVNSTPQKGRKLDMYQSPIRKKSSSLMVHQDDMENELKTIGITLDMLELLTGVRMINYEEDKERFYFDVKQTSTNMEHDVDSVSVEYKLVIKRKFEQAAEVTYVPAFLRNLKTVLKDPEQELKNQDAARVAKHLPDYLQENLIFPYNTLLQFYTKMNKALNKSTKS